MRSDDGSISYVGIEMVSGHHFQHVANDALQQDMFDAIVNRSETTPGPTVSSASSVPSALGTHETRKENV